MSKNNISITIRTDREIKEKAAKVFSSIGMDMSTAVNVFLRQAIRFNGLPFELRADDEPNEETYAAMKAAECDEDMFGPFDSVASLMEALNA